MLGLLDRWSWGLYDWTLRLAAHRHAMPALGLVSFVESSVFPIPPDVMIAPMVLANRAKAWLIAAWASVTSVAGGALGYLIGYGLFESVGRPILEAYGSVESFGGFQETFNDLGWWLVIGAGITPFPYKVITIASGVAGLDFVTFMLASLVGRAGRFFLVAGLIWAFGPPIQRFVEKRLGLTVLVFFVLLFGGFLALRFLP